MGELILCESSEEVSYQLALETASVLEDNRRLISVFIRAHRFILT